MTFVLNEHEWARDMIESKTLGKRPFETLTRVARYYIDTGYKKDAVRKMLETFLVQSRPDASVALWMDTIDRAIATASKRAAVSIDRIIVTKPEMELIEGLNGVLTQRLAFTLLCLAKYYDAVNPDAGHWVCADDQDIMSMANIKTSIRRQSALYRQLRDEGMLRFSKKVDNTNVCVLYITDGPPAISVTDFRNLGNQYLMYKGEPGYYRCENCGVIAHTKHGGDYSIARRGRPKKYCDECAAAIKNEWTAS